MSNQTSRPTNPEAEKLLNLYFPVLDHGFISLRDYMGTDECIEGAARVSYGAGTRQVSQTRGLIRYLRRHRHSTPYEMVELKFHMCMPIFVARQFIRHRTANVNEYSGRYSLMPMLFYTPQEEQFQKQSKSNNQGRDQKLEHTQYSVTVDRWNKLRKNSQELYEDMTEADVARELARIDLPLSTYTQWFWKIDLHNLLHFLSLRVDPHAQWEIRQYGEVMAGMLKLVAPLSYEAWVDYDVCGAKFSFDEMKAIRRIIETGRPIASVVADEDVQLNKREIDEFYTKLKESPKPNFDLDLSKAKPPEFFEKKMRAAVPTIDKVQHET